MDPVSATTSSCRHGPAAGQSVSAGGEVQLRAAAGRYPPADPGPPCGGRPGREQAPGPIASTPMTRVTEPSAEHEVDIHTTAGKLADLRKRTEETLHPGRRGRGREGPRQGQADRPRAHLRAAGRGLLRRTRRAGQAPQHQLRAGGEAAAGRRRGHRLRHHRRPRRVHLQPGRHRVRRQPRRGVRREDRQGAGSGPQDRPPADRHQRRRGRTHPGGRGLAGPVQPDLPQQHPGLRRHPADLADHGRRGRRPRLLPRADRLRRHGRPDQPDVHHRPGRHQDRHRRGGDDGGARRRAHPHGQVRPRALRRLRRAGRLRLRPRPAELPAANNYADPPRYPGRGARGRDRGQPSPTRTSSWTR